MGKDTLQILRECFGGQQISSVLYSFPPHFYVLGFSLHILVRNTPNCILQSEDARGVLLSHRFRSPMTPGTTTSFSHLIGQTSSRKHHGHQRPHPSPRWPLLLHPHHHSTTPPSSRRRTAARTSTSSSAATRSPPGGASKSWPWGRGPSSSRRSPPHCHHHPHPHHLLHLHFLLRVVLHPRHDNPNLYTTA